MGNERDRLETCSEEYARIFETSVDQALEAQDSPKKFLPLIHPEDRQRVAKEALHFTEIP